MAKRPHLRFGDRETSDVILRWTYPDGSEYHGNPLFLHSSILEKSAFFEAMLSERWSSKTRPLELKIGIRHDVDSYVKCIRFMYLSDVQKRRYFTGVREALLILEISSEFMIKECTEACMQYLEAVRWTSEEKLQITGLISTLQLKPSSDLAARLGVSELLCDGEIGKELGSLMSSISTEERDRDTAVKLLFANFDADTTPACADSMASALCSGLGSNLEVIKSQFKSTKSTGNFLSSVGSPSFSSVGTTHASLFGPSTFTSFSPAAKFGSLSPASSSGNTVLKDIGNPVRKDVEAASSSLLWLLEYLQKLQMLEPAVKLFAEDQHDLIDALRCDHERLFADTLFKILIILLHALGNGEVICSIAVRLSFVATWWVAVDEVYPCNDVTRVDDDVQKNRLYFDSTNSRGGRAFYWKLVEEMIGVVETLPLVDRVQVVKIWKKGCQKSLNRNISYAIELCCDNLKRLLIS